MLILLPYSETEMEEILSILHKDLLQNNNNLSADDFSIRNASLLKTLLYDLKNNTFFSFVISEKITIWELFCWK